MNHDWVGGTCSLECLTNASGANCAAEAVGCLCFALILFNFSGQPGGSGHS